jgi:hypothetical protein
LNSFTSINIEPIWHTDNLNFFEQYLKESNDLLVLTLLWESPPLDKWKYRFQNLVSRAKSAGKNIILIINSWYRKDKDQLEKCGADEVVFLDFFLTLIYLRLIKNQESKVRDRWSPDSNNWLFLTGKPNKENRLPLLYRLHQENLLDRCIWSLFVTENTIEQSKNCLTNLGERSAIEWLEKFLRNPDDIIIDKNNLHYSGIPYGDIYESCLFQLVPETAIHLTNPWITEKTWLPIINRCPFLIFGDSGSNEKLKKLGFYTFDEFLVDSDFDKSLPVDKRKDSIVRNIRHWLEVLPANSQLVNEIVEHNHHRLVELASKNIHQLEKIHQKYQMKKSIFDMVRFVDDIQHAQWHNWYQRIRDPAWPDCDREEDFNKLPKWIQNECIDIFGYQPKEKQ